MSKTKISRRFKSASQLVEDKLYHYVDAIELMRKSASAKFDETVEAHIVPVSYTHLTLPTKRIV